MIVSLLISLPLAILPLLHCSKGDKKPKKRGHMPGGPPPATSLMSERKTATSQREKPSERSQPTNSSNMTEKEKTKKETEMKKAEEPSRNKTTVRTAASTMSRAATAKSSMFRLKAKPSKVRQSTMMSMDTTSMGMRPGEGVHDDGGYEACPDISPEELARIAQGK